MNEAIELVQQERRRQIEAEGWSLEHDDQHTGCAMNVAAQCYAEAARRLALGGLPDRGASGAGYAWPWDEKWWKPSPDPIRNLVKAAALLVAEIERLQRDEKSDEINRKSREAARRDEIANAERILESASRT